MFPRVRSTTSGEQKSPCRAIARRSGSSPSPLRPRPNGENLLRPRCAWVGEDTQNNTHRTESMVMKQKRKLGNLGQHFLGGVATVIGLCALSTPAQAETVIFVLDQSGSMARAGLSGNIENGVRWDDATSAARVWAESYAQSAEQGHAVSVWGFKDGGAAQLWPSTDEDCTDLEGGEIENLYGEDSLDPIGTI